MSSCTLHRIGCTNQQRERGADDHELVYGMTLPSLLGHERSLTTGLLREAVPLASFSSVSSFCLEVLHSPSLGSVRVAPGGRSPEHSEDCTSPSCPLDWSAGSNMCVSTCPVPRNPLDQHFQSSPLHEKRHIHDDCAGGITGRDLVLR